MGTKTVVPLLIVGICAVIVSTDDTRHPEDCSLPLDMGFCRAHFSRWGFDIATKKCKEFTYGGCGGNANSFENEEDCIAKCTEKSKTKPEPAEVNRGFEIVSGSCSCKCPKCNVIPKIEQTGRGFPEYR